MGFSFTMLVSGVQQSDSVIYVYVYPYIHPFFFRFFSHIDYYRILSRVSVLCSRSLLIILYMVVCTH